MWVTRNVKLISQERSLHMKRTWGQGGDTGEQQYLRCKQTTQVAYGYLSRLGGWGRGWGSNWKGSEFPTGVLPVYFLLEQEQLQPAEVLAFVFKKNMNKTRKKYEKHTENSLLWASFGKSHETMRLWRSDRIDLFCQSLCRLCRTLAAAIHGCWWCFFMFLYFVWEKYGYVFSEIW